MMTPTGGGSDGQSLDSLLVRHALLLLFRSSRRLVQTENSESFFLVHTDFRDFKACRWLCEAGWLFATLSTVYVDYALLHSICIGFN